MRTHEGDGSPSPGEFVEFTASLESVSEILDVILPVPPRHLRRQTHANERTEGCLEEAPRISLALCRFRPRGFGGFPENEELQCVLDTVREAAGAVALAGIPSSASEPRVKMKRDSHRHGECVVHGPRPAQSHGSWTSASTGRLPGPNVGPQSSPRWPCGPPLT